MKQVRPQLRVPAGDLPSTEAGDDLAEYGILVNIVVPNCTHTSMSIGIDETQTLVVDGGLTITF